jgi:hypothetical protein
MTTSMHHRGNSADGTYTITDAAKTWGHTANCRTDFLPTFPSRRHLFSGYFRSLSVAKRRIPLTSRDMIALRDLIVWRRKKPPPKQTQMPSPITTTFACFRRDELLIGFDIDEFGRRPTRKKNKCRGSWDTRAVANCHWLSPRGRLIYRSLCNVGKN